MELYKAFYEKKRKCIPIKLDCGEDNFCDNCPWNLPLQSHLYFSHLSPIFYFLTNNKGRSKSLVHGELIGGGGFVVVCGTPSGDTWRFPNTLAKGTKFPSGL